MYPAAARLSSASTTLGSPRVQRGGDERVAIKMVNDMRGLRTKRITIDVPKSNTGNLTWASSVRKQFLGSDLTEFR
jgi:hypothetical protein